MSNRYRLSRGKSRRSFSRSADRIHSKNIMPAPMRGGIRL